MPEIRNALLSDTQSLIQLLLEAGYPDASELLKTKLVQFLLHPKTELLVAVENDELQGVIPAEATTELTTPSTKYYVRLFIISGYAVFPIATHEALITAAETFVHGKAADDLILPHRIALPHKAVADR